MRIKSVLSQKASRGWGKLALLFHSRVLSLKTLVVDYSLPAHFPNSNEYNSSFITLHIFVLKITDFHYKLFMQYIIQTVYVPQFIISSYRFGFWGTRSTE